METRAGKGPRYQPLLLSDSWNSINCSDYQRIGPTRNSLCSSLESRVFSTKTVMIQRVIGRQIYDSRGNPTVEVEVTTELGVFRAAVPRFE